MSRLTTIIRTGAFLLALASSWVALEAAEPRPGERPLTAAECDRLLDRMEKSLGSVRSLRVAFDQEKHLSLLADVVKSRGSCYFVRPATVRFQIDEPFRSVLIAQGKSVAKYEFSGGRWQKLKLDAPDVILMVTGQIASWLKGHFREQTDIYDISALAGEHTVILLTPRNADMRRHIRVIELELSKNEWAVAAVTIRESGDDFTRLVFSAEERDIELPASIFSTSGDAPAEVDQRVAPHVPDRAKTE